MKTICFFSGDITRGGGTEKVAVWLCNRLHREAPDLSVRILSLTEQKAAPFFPLDETIPRHALSDRWLSPGPAYLKLIPKVKRYLSEHHVDLIVDIDIVLDVLSVPAAKGRGTKVISWEHFNLVYENKIFYRRMILRHFTAKADALVTLTRSDAEAMAAYLPKCRRILFLYNPMEPAGASSGEKKKQILTAGHLIPRKGIPELMEIAKLFLTKHPDWTWVVAGSGPLETELHTFIENEHLAGKLIPAGRIQDMEPLYQSTAVYAMTSRLEGLPMTLLEAKARSLPIVSFDIPTGPSEIIKDAVNGYLIPAFDTALFAERLGRLAEDDKLLAYMQSHAMDEAEKFSEDHILSQWRSLLLEAF